MPSSISGSKAWSPQRGIVVLLSLMVLFAIVMELLGRVGFEHVSRVQRRIAADYSQARTLQPRTPDGKVTVLLVGNSLLLEAIDVAALRNEVAPRYSVNRWSVESTNVLDWYFALRRTFREGSRPGVVVLFLSTSSLISSNTRGEYFAYFLMDARDIVQVSRAAKLDMTPASNYWFAHWSGWLGGRAEIRKWELMKTIPHFELLGSFVSAAPPFESDPKIEESVRPRLLALKELCGSHGARFILVVPPSQMSERSSTVAAAGTKVGVPVLVPYHEGEMPKQWYADGYHLNAAGAAVFTARFGAQLLDVLGTDRQENGSTGSTTPLPAAAHSSK